MNFAKPIEELIYQLSRLPGIGRKSAQRTAFYILEMGEERVEALIRALGEAQRTIHPCKRCNSLTEGDLCIVCLNDEREKSKLCLVEDTKKMAAIESTGKFNGYYFVLRGLLSPIKKIGPEEIHIPMLEEILDEGNIKGRGALSLHADVRRGGAIRRRFLDRKRRRQRGKIKYFQDKQSPSKIGRASCRERV